MEQKEIIQYIEDEMTLTSKRIQTILQLIEELAWERRVNTMVAGSEVKTVTEELRDKELVKRVRALTCQSITEYEKRAMLERIIQRISSSTETREKIK